MSYSPSNRVIRLLLAGKYPLCCLDHIRHICSKRYCNKCITPLVRNLFSFVRDVVVVRSNDVDLVSIVEQNGGQVTTPYLTSIVHSFTYLQSFCLDLHPELDVYMKTLSPMESNDNLRYGPSEDDTTRYAFSNSFHMCWGIMDTTTDNATITTTTDDANTNPINKILDMCLESCARTLFQTVARDVFGIPSLYPAPLDVLTRIAMMKFKSLHHKFAPVLFVYPTGGRKSLVRDVHSVLFRGVSFTIVQVLLLGADLSIKVKQKES